MVKGGRQGALVALSLALSSPDVEGASKGECESASSYICMSLLPSQALTRNA